MRLSDFDFDLPADRIALRPASPRDQARLLLVNGETLTDCKVCDLPDLLRPGDLLVLNDTRVIPARLKGVRTRGDSRIAVQATLLSKVLPDTWLALMRPAKKLQVQDKLDFGSLAATVIHKGERGEILLTFAAEGAELDAAIEAEGTMPLPPYIAAKRPEDAADRTDYQTIYARHDGSVAAPTAGLHFTPDLFAALEARGVQVAYVTLHVGAGTFLPVKTDEVAEHRMHAETGEVSAETAARINAVRAAGGRVIPVGTTSLRLIESAADEAGEVGPFAGDTDIFITPGYRFRVADGLMTNFHLPKSTLFMLVCALAGTDAMRAAYAHAVATNYRFYSYGDASLLWRADG